MKQRKEWVAPGDTLKQRVKPELHPRKTMICIWRDWEMLERNAAVNKELYIAQLQHVTEVYSTEKTPTTRSNHTSS